MDDPRMVGLVRVVALDGSVWWVDPAVADWYRTVPSAGRVVR